MSQIAVKKVDDEGKKVLPVFAEIAKRFKAVERRAFDLFERRGCVLGHDVEDWLNAEHELLGWPAAKLGEKDGAYDVQIALPGFDVKDVEVTATPSEIVVHAAAKQESKTEKDNVLWTEFGSSDVYRRFEVPNPINVDKVTANIENGLLRINAPQLTKPKEAAAKAA
jgi:HSP20 family molecular chaperone IbpA